MALLGIDTSNVEPSEAFEVLPVGEYLAMIVASDMVQTKDGAGHFLKLEFQIVGEGVGKGRKVWERLNIDNPKEETQTYAYRDLAAIQKAIGKPGKIGDSEELHDIPMKITLKIEPPKGNYGASNAIKSYKSADAASTPPAVATPAAAAAPAAAATPPWMKR